MKITKRQLRRIIREAALDQGLTLSDYAETEEDYAQLDWEEAQRLVSQDMDDGMPGASLQSATDPEMYIELMREIDPTFMTGDDGKPPRAEDEAGGGYNPSVPELKESQLRGLVEEVMQEGLWDKITSMFDKALPERDPVHSFMYGMIKGGFGQYEEPMIDAIKLQVSEGEFSEEDVKEAYKNIKDMEKKDKHDERALEILEKMGLGSKNENRQLRMMIRNILKGQKR